MVAKGRGPQKQLEHIRAGMMDMRKTGASLREIAKHFDVSHMTVKNYTDGS
jgi:DNA-binding CsgD family transcriptional regulator